MVTNDLSLAVWITGASALYVLSFLMSNYFIIRKNYLKIAKNVLSRTYLFIYF